LLTVIAVLVVGCGSTADHRAPATTGGSRTDVGSGQSAPRSQVGQSIGATAAETKVEGSSTEEGDEPAIRVGGATVRSDKLEDEVRSSGK